MRRLPMWLAASVVAASVVAACRESALPEVEIVEPIDGATLEGPDVNVVLAATGIEIAPASDERPGTAHHHLFVDHDLLPLSDSIPSGVTGILHLGRGQTEFTIRDLEPGPHRVIALLADRRHVPIVPSAADTVEFTIQPGAAPPGPDSTAAPGR